MPRVFYGERVKRVEGPTIKNSQKQKSTSIHGVLFYMANNIASYPKCFNAERSNTSTGSSPLNPSIASLASSFE